ncbi:polysaccharide pyruvyl transferase family protein [Isoptericola haloaureus]|uniref:Polysaccharide pyruvyl transferase family protein n=1 Tax=Isoptericola haloaureus TaxID=1542902 RepID=A0ABU7Z4L4_9MICO
MFGLFGIGNFGNEATLTAVLERIGDRGRVLVVAEGAERVARERGLAAVQLVPPSTGSTRSVAGAVRVAANRLSALPRAWHVLRDVDVVVVAGGGAWERLGAGPFGTAFEIWSLALAARARRRTFVLLDVGVQEQDARLTRFFVRQVARWSAYRSVRDELSRRSLLAMGAGRPDDPVVADLVLGSSRTSDVADRRAGSGRPVVVGVMSYFAEDDDPDRRAEVHERYVDRSVRLVDLLTAAGHPVVLVGGDECDLPTAHEIASSSAAQVSSAGDVAELTSLMSRASVVVGARYHTLVVGALAGAPVIALAYGTKHGELLRALGSGDLSFDIETFEPSVVAAAVDQVVVEREHRRLDADRAITAAAARLDREWVTVARLWETDDRSPATSLVEEGR